jgi:hypothetical protein
MRRNTFVSRCTYGGLTTVEPRYIRVPLAIESSRAGKVCSGILRSQRISCDPTGLPDLPSMKGKQAQRKCIVSVGADQWEGGIVPHGESILMSGHNEEMGKTKGATLGSPPLLLAVSPALPLVHSTHSTHAAHSTTLRHWRVRRGFLRLLGDHGFRRQEQGRD